jgi:hypothetical protein
LKEIALEKQKFFREIKPGIGKLKNFAWPGRTGRLFLEILLGEGENFFARAKKWPSRPAFADPQIKQLTKLIPTCESRF